MLMARKVSAWRSRYEVTIDGRPVAVWDGSLWKSGGDFELDGRRYRVRGNAWGNRFGMVDGDGTTVASADRVGRKRWTVEAAGHTYHFQRSSMWSSEQELHTVRGRAGSLKRVGFWRRDVVADLPGLPPPVQVFVLGVVVTMWEAQSAAV
jgi:hypothetical protein